MSLFASILMLSFNFLACCSCFGTFRKSKLLVLLCFPYLSLTTILTLSYLLTLEVVLHNRTLKICQVTWNYYLSILFVCSDSHLFNPGTDFKDGASSDSVVLARGTCDVRKQGSVTQATQTSPTSPEPSLPSQPAAIPECPADVTREQVKEP